VNDAASPTDEPLMRRDRDGSWVLEDPAHRCWKGWKGYDAEGRPIPCLTCKPHLIKRTPDYTDPLEHLTEGHDR